MNKSIRYLKTRQVFQNKRRFRRFKYTNSWSMHHEAPLPPKKGFLKKYGRIFISGFSLFALGCWALSYTERKKLVYTSRTVLVMPYSWEKFIGKCVKDIILSNFGESIVDPSHYVFKHIKKVGDRLSEKNDIPIHEYILIDSPLEIVFCIPGNTIVIFTGTLPLFQNESQLAMILARELAHSIAKHYLAEYFIFIPFSWLLESFGGRLGWTLGYLSTFSFYKQNELEADSIAMHLLAKSCYDVEDGINSLIRYQSVTQEEDDDIDDSVFLSITPQLDTRVNKLVQEKNSKAVQELRGSCGDQSPKTFKSYNLLSKLNHPISFPKITYAEYKKKEQQKIRLLSNNLIL